MNTDTSGEPRRTIIQKYAWVSDEPDTSPNGGPYELTITHESPVPDWGNAPLSYRDLQPPKPAIRKGFRSPRTGKHRNQR